ncbi:MAG: hypothetical protein HKN33_18310 [Pyrinomonadaceae bacterium]|nr:hypothetical protein [Pyrinomonadaceae bacterium]
MHKFTDRHNLRAGWLVAFCLLMLFCSLESRAYSDQGQKGSPGADRLSLSVLLNEIVVNPNGGDDNCEYIELLGFANEPLSSIYFVSLEGDSGSNEGAADFVSNLGALSLGPNGLLVITAMDTTGVCGTRTYNSPPTVLVRDADLDGGRLENGTNSWLLVSSPTTAILEGTDYDTDDNGTLEGLPADAIILDAVGWTDGGGADINYGGVVLPSTAGGTNDMATRFPGDATPNSAAAWYHGDMDGAADSLMYDLTQVSANFPSGGMLTPGLPNVGMATASQPANVDFDGDGSSDYAVIRNTFSMPSLNRKSSARKNRIGSPQPGTELEWWIAQSSDNAQSVTPFGMSGAPGDSLGNGADRITPADFDGDGKTDIAVWRQLSFGQPSANAFFFVLNSSDSTVDTIDFGQIGDNPTIVGDYDGDGMADPAVFRCESLPVLGGPSGQCTFFYAGSAGSGITYVPWGFDAVPYPGDFDGDGSFDFCIYRADPSSPAGGAGFGQYVLLRSSDSGIEYINYGLIGDTLVPGDYDGDGQTDFMNVRLDGTPPPVRGQGFGAGSGQVQWYLLERDGGGTGGGFIPWGFVGLAGYEEQLAHGDYDGDGITDIGIYRNSLVDFDDSFFYILKSSDGGLLSYEWGQPNDFATAGWNGQN